MQKDPDMRTIKLCITVCLPLLLAVACSDDSTGNNLDGGGGAADGGADTGGGGPSALQAVVNKLLLPKSEKEYAADLDGDGKQENQVGKLMAAFKALNPTYDAQADFNKFIADGKLLMLFDLKATGIANDANARLKFYLGVDTDGNAKNNFSGSAKLKVDPKGPKGLELKATIANRKLTAGPGTMSVPVPVGQTPTVVSLKATRVTATLATTGMASGKIIGAIPQADVDNKLVPALAGALDTTWKDKDTQPSTKKLLDGFDMDGDGTISGKDLKNNAIVGMLFSADVDLDGDKTKDALSMGVGFAGVTCKIQP